MTAQGDPIALSPNGLLVVQVDGSVRIASMHSSSTHFWVVSCTFEAAAAELDAALGEVNFDAVGKQARERLATTRGDLP